MIQAPLPANSENATANSFKQGFIWVDCFWEKLGLKSIIFQAFQQFHQQSAYFQD